MRQKQTKKKHIFLNTQTHFYQIKKIYKTNWITLKHEKNPEVTNLNSIKTQKRKKGQTEKKKKEKKLEGKKFG